MSQEDCLKFLKKNKEEWFSASEIAAALNVKVGSIRNNLRKLRGNKYNSYSFIKHKEMGLLRSKSVFVYKYKDNNFEGENEI